MTKIFKFPETVSSCEMCPNHKKKDIGFGFGGGMLADYCCLQAPLSKYVTVSELFKSCPLEDAEEAHE